jgi:hypothetical protein
VLAWLHLGGALRRGGATVTPSKSTVEVGQVWEDSYISRPGKDRWLVRVMRLNEKSARVEPCADDGWMLPIGYEWGYRMEYKHFENGRMQPIRHCEA